MVGRAAEKIWGAASLAVKAYAWKRENKRLVSHRELWEYARKISRELGDWFLHAWHEANTMHTCFYEAWCSREDVEIAYKRVERLVKELRSRL